MHSEDTLHAIHISLLPTILYLDLLKIKCPLINDPFTQGPLVTNQRRCLPWFKPRETVHSAREIYVQGIQHKISELISRQKYYTVVWLWLFTR